MFEQISPAPPRKRLSGRTKVNIAVVITALFLLGFLYWGAIKLYDWKNHPPIQKPDAVNTDSINKVAAARKVLAGARLVEAHHQKAEQFRAMLDSVNAEDSSQAKNLIFTATGINPDRRDTVKVPDITLATKPAPAKTEVASHPKAKAKMPRQFASHRKCHCAFKTVARSKRLPPNEVVIYP
ncbi:MAG: hypothetical protein NVSMB66_1020 [Candidatus Doudnabacteria bacterium]